MNIQILKDELNKHLTEDILPFWMELKDDEYGGFYGEVSADGSTDRHADKGCILNSRILWTFSNCFLRYGSKEYLKTADIAYRQLKDTFADTEFGGVYWSVTYDGKPLDTVKHTYNQAFAIYGLCAYYEATGDEKALDHALGLYKIIESRCRDDIGYLEAFDREWKPAGNDKLSENGVEAYRTMNTLLHIYEAYTELYRVTNGRYAKAELEFIVRLVTDSIYNEKEHRLDVFFDREYKSIIDLQSYGHDIEASWLMEKGLDVLAGSGGSDTDAVKKLRTILSDLTATVYDRAYKDGLLYNECENGVTDTGHIWWAQAESMIGFMNGYKHTAKQEYLDAVFSIWNSLKDRYIVHLNGHNGGEWYWGILKDGTIDTEDPVAGIWKCPYHNSRMCLELTS